MDFAGAGRFFRHQLHPLLLEKSLKTLLFSLFAFLLGSVPTGLLVARFRGVDVRTAGSGNIGATNVLRTAGRWPALITLIGDIAKGSLAVAAVRFLDGGVTAEGIAGLCAVLGHNFSVFLNFRGGKGVATGIGVVCIYAPQSGIVTIILWLMTVLVTRYSSMGALVAFGSLPAVIAMLDAPEKLPVALFMAAIIIARHRDNIRRLLAGTEPRVGKR